MSGQNAKRSEDATSTASELDAILRRLHALGGSPQTDDSAQSRSLRSVPDLTDSDTSQDPEPELVPPPLETAVEPVEPVELVSSVQEAPTEFASSLPQTPPEFESSLEETPTEVDSSLDQTPTEIVPVDVSSPVDMSSPVTEVDDPELVFELDGPLVFEEPPVEAATESPVAEVADVLPLIAPPPVPLEVEAEALEPSEPLDSTGEWVSYHDESVDSGSTSASPVLPVENAIDPFASEESLVDPFHELDETEHVDASPAVEEAMQTLDAPEWSSEPEVEDTDLFGQLSIDDDAGDPVTDTHPLDIEETLDFSELEDSNGLAELAGDLELIGEVDSEPLPSMEGNSDFGAMYESDADLPLPDFTGVWVESGEESIWDKDAAAIDATGIPEPIERVGRGSGISVGRNELDSLRPVDEEDPVEEQPEGAARKLQLVMVVLFGLIALAIMFLDDPGAADEIRGIYDQFFG